MQRNIFLKRLITNREQNLETINSLPSFISSTRNFYTKDVKIWGNSYQEKTPIDFKPEQIVNLGGEIRQADGSFKYAFYLRATKNLFDLEKALVLDNWLKDTYQYFTSFTFEKGKTYTVSYTLKDKSKVINDTMVQIFEKESKNYVETIFTSYMLEEINEGERKSITFTPTEDSYLAVYKPNYMDESEIESYFTLFTCDWQIEVGEIPTAYSNYGEGDLEFLLDSPLCSVGDFKDVLDLKNSQVQKNTGVIRVDGDNVWNLRVRDGKTYFSTKVDGILPSDNMITVKSEWHQSATIQDSFFHDYTIWAENGEVCLYDSYYNGLGMEDWREQIDYDWFKIVYATDKRIEPISENKLNFFKGNTRLSIDANVEPSKVEIKHKKV